jgi:hypothetical protein
MKIAELPLSFAEATGAMATAIPRWSADAEIAQLPLERRHALCPFGVGFFVSETGALCENCFSRQVFEPDLATAALPCACRFAPEAVDFRFVQGRWTARCAGCGKIWQGMRLLGEHGRWEQTSPRLVPARPAGTRAPDWFFERQLKVIGTSAGSVSFRKGQMLAGVSVVLPNRRPLKGQLDPFGLTFFPEDRPEDLQKLIPDSATRERVRAAMAWAIRERLEEGARGGASLLHARGVANYATRVFDLLE